MEYLKKMKKCKDPEALIDQWVSDEQILQHQDKGTKYGLLHAGILWEDDDVFKSQLEAILGKTEDLPELRASILEMKDSNKFTPQMLAISLGNYFAATKLQKCGCNVDVSNGQQSVQQLAALSNNRELIIDVLKHNADINSKNSNSTALMQAIKENCEYSVEELTNNEKLDWGITDLNGNNYLLAAIENSNNDAASIILTKLDEFHELPESDPKSSLPKFMITHKNKVGMSSVHLAASLDRQMIYSLLLKKSILFGFDVETIRDASGKTAADYFADAAEERLAKDRLKKEKSVDAQAARRRKTEMQKQESENRKKNEVLLKQKQKEAEVRQELIREEEQGLMKYKILMFFIVIFTAFYLQMKWQEIKGSPGKGINKDFQGSGFDI